MKVRKIFEVIGWVIIGLFVLIGISSSIGQIPPGGNSYNDGFEVYPIATLLHVVPGIIFMVLGPFQFIGKIRERFRNFHRWSGRIFMINSVLIGISGLVIVVLFPFAGLSEQIATFVFATVFLFSIYKALDHIKKYEIEEHREWMIRVFSIGLGIGAIRVLIILFSIFTTYQQVDFFALTFWLGFGGTWAVGEVWIRATRKKII
jgi:uncharacterized membrane protein